MLIESTEKTGDKEVEWGSAKPSNPTHMSAVKLYEGEQIRKKMWPPANRVKVNVWVMIKQKGTNTLGVIFCHTFTVASSQRSAIRIKVQGFGLHLPPAKSDLPGILLLVWKKWAEEQQWDEGGGINHTYSQWRCRKGIMFVFSSIDPMAFRSTVRPLTALEAAGAGLGVLVRDQNMTTRGLKTSISFKFDTVWCWQNGV